MPTLYHQIPTPHGGTNPEYHSCGSHSSGPQERTTADLLPGMHRVTAAHPNSSLFYLSKAVRVERTCRNYQDVSSGCCGKYSYPEANFPSIYGDNEVHFRTVAADNEVV